MDIQNHFYGHSALLAQAAGLPRARHLAGLLQHGWVGRSPLQVNFGDFPDVGAPGDGRRLLVWTHESRAWRPDPRPTRPTTPIGAPWLYAVAVAVAPGAGPEPSGVHIPRPTTVADGRPVIMPMHGTHVLSVQTDHGELARYYADTEGSSLVCLHHEDLARPEVVRAWAAAGHEVVSAGGRFDPLFLPRLLTGLGGASRVVSNRLSTSVWYAASLGVPSCVHGPRALMAGESPDVVERLERLWPEVHTTSPDVDAVRAVADAELGAQHVREPEELRRLLGWEGAFSARPAFDYWLGAPLQKAATVLGLRRRSAGAHQVEPAGVGGEAGVECGVQSGGPSEVESGSASGVGSGSAAGVESADGHSSLAAQPSPLSFLRHPLSHLPRQLPRSTWAGEPVPWLRPPA